MTSEPKKVNYLKIINRISITIIIFVILFVAFSLYKNVYQTISHSKEIIVLRSQVILKTPNVAKFSLITEKLDLKINPVLINFAQLKNIFIPIDQSGEAEESILE